MKRGVPVSDEYYDIHRREIDAYIHRMRNHGCCKCPNDHTSDEFGIYTSEKDIHSAPARDQSFISVPGRNGDVLLDNGRYENVNVSYTCYCKDLVSNMDEIKAWLCQPGYFQLQDGYNPLMIRYASF